MKAAEDGDGFILRLVETDGVQTEATLDFAALNIRFTVQCGPQEIKTIRLRRDGTVEECLIIE